MATTPLGKPAISTPNRLDLRDVQGAISNTRQRIEALEAIARLLQSPSTSLTALAALVATLTTRVNGLVAATGTVTSVDATVPSFLSVTGVPITGAGTIAIALEDQQASTVFAGPVGGADDAPTFRNLEWNYDIPLFSTLSNVSGVEGDELILIERYGVFRWVTLDQVVALANDLSGVALLADDNVFTKAQSVTPVALTDGTNIATDAEASNNFRVTLGGNRTLDNPTNLKNSAVYQWKVKQDGTGSRTLAYGSKFKWPGGTPPVLSTAASATDLISAQYWSDDDILLATILKGFA